MDSFAITEGLAAQDQPEAPSEPVNSKLSEETNKFQRAIAAWRGINPRICGASSWPIRN